MTIRTTAVGNLPAALTTFVGRYRDLAEVRRRLGTTRLLTLTGAGGVGKTRLALQVAAASTTDFADGVWLVDLAPLRDPSLTANTVAAALGVPDLGTRPVVDQLAAFLTHRSPLIVLDNCEHLIDACAELAHALLSASCGMRILTTSRRALGIHGEHVFVVPPLTPDDAVELLRDRTIAVRPEFRVTESNRAQVLRLCEDLDGLPLAIELTASRLRTLTVDEAVNRLEDRFGLLTSGCRVARPHQRTLRALIDWSHELCTPAERLLWNRLSVFADDFCLDAAEDVCAGDGIGRDEVLDLLDRLVVQSVVQSVVLPCGREGLPRYRLLATIRQYGRERLAESGEEQRTLRRHRDFYLALAERLADGWYGPGQQESLTLLRAEHANLRSALAQGGDPQATLALAAALRFHWCEGGFLGEGRRWLDHALTAAPEPSPARARGLWVAAWVAVLQHDHAAAYRLLDEAAELGERMADRVVSAHVQNLRGTLALFSGRLVEAVSLLEEAVVAHRRTNEEIGAVYTLILMATAQAHLGDPGTTETCRQALALAEAHDERLARAHAQWTLGYDAWVRRDLAEAAVMIRAALENEQGFNDYIRVALMLEQLAWVTTASGDHQRAGRLLGAARVLWRDIDTSISTFGPHMVDQHAECEEEIVRVLGPAAYEDALVQGGRHRGPAEAIAYALRAEAEPTAPAPAAATVPAPSPLTPREREVAALIAEGMSNRQIASALGRSPRTVHGHVENILAKLAFGSRARIASWWTANQGPTP
ncbi:LuxR C-terminal-related transcriptional regulator [Streptomyces europaeiscabiei]|uniref:LuxR C-terminal-related transcriptional regulator n=1 Tax=Streptomyces europaeiscabiei TaxID=146819 RepID=UPI0029B5BF6F|nr:LuxR C-terminal-related transcriptional regulator [Streptomyces europaeiscabiei]MDX3629138.1 LuxR C-terminal-related transcriptional regulator [Streptomyces europaeiscabiei]MDX3647244.1 LuxR C-terminal-related transcriptional regulator [Streptomyces europaeiscabiei]WUD36052.1 LuxR C-terminal-related transcriptional regulator [Streptomyces europaeiscabiei]